ncbi:hypothetical protein DPMN_052687 [Dreissena polymorpha]|uniref:Uncharacterized protein n=1 Tax=Dreissena polymorpha TaxID=45954 RepID=A0A9D4CLQ5_DREPO|nr:hypothetical protein DPMN_052687 [Dreissena polymorpha]
MDDVPHTNNFIHEGVGGGVKVNELLTNDNTRNSVASDILSAIIPGEDFARQSASLCRDALVERQRKTRTSESDEGRTVPPRILTIDMNKGMKIIENKNIECRCPLSSSLFIICIGYLSHYIQSNKHIKGISLEPDEEIKQSLLADDATNFQMTKCPAFKGAKECERQQRFSLMLSLRLKGTTKCERQQWSSRIKNIERQHWSSHIRSASDSSGIRKFNMMVDFENDDNDDDNNDDYNDDDFDADAAADDDDDDDFDDYDDDDEEEEECYEHTKNKKTATVTAKKNDLLRV